ncbi:MAG: hypothetical protein ACXWEK_07760, partial [Solirubrobacterales bacterium]
QPALAPPVDPSTQPVAPNATTPASATTPDPAVVDPNAPPDEQVVEPTPIDQASVGGLTATGGLTTHKRGAKRKRPKATADSKGDSGQSDGSTSGGAADQGTGSAAPPPPPPPPPGGGISL